MPTEARTLKQKRKKLKDLNSKEIGFNPQEVIQSENADDVISVLSARHGLQKLCSRSTEDFNPETKDHFDQTFSRFCSSSDLLLDRMHEDTLTVNFDADKFHTEVESVKEMVRRKQEELASRKEQLDAVYSQEQEQLAGGEQEQLVTGEQESSHEQEEGPRQHVVPDLESPKLILGCKAHCSCGLVEVGLAPTIQLERGAKPKLVLGVDLEFNNSSTSREKGVEVSLCAQKGRCEASVESNFLESGREYGLTAQVNCPHNLTFGILSRNRSFNKLASPLSFARNSHVFLGGKLKRSSVITNVRFGVLPVEELKDLVTSDSFHSVNESRLDRDSPFFDEQDQLDLPCKELDDLEFVLSQDESQTDLLVNGILVHQAETTKEQEKEIRHEENEIPVERKSEEQKHQFLILDTPTPPAQSFKRSSFQQTLLPYEWFSFALVAGLAGLGLLVEIFGDKLGSRNENSKPGLNPFRRFNHPFFSQLDSFIVPRFGIL